MKAVRLSIAGHVQGVGFRAWTRRTARDLGIRGWVQNERDGTVTAHAEGDNAAVDRLVEACHHGPGAAAVGRVSITDVPPENFADFRQR